MRLHFLLVALWTNCSLGGAPFDFPTMGVLGKGKFAYVCPGTFGDGGVADLSDLACDGSDPSTFVPSAVAKGSLIQIAMQEQKTLVSSDEKVIEPALNTLPGFFFDLGTMFSARGLGSAEISGSATSGRDFVSIEVVDIATLDAPKTDIVMTPGRLSSVTLTPRDAANAPLAGRLYCDWDTRDSRVARADGTTRFGSIRAVGEGSTKIVVTCAGATTEIAIIVNAPPPKPDASTLDASSDAPTDAPFDAPDGD